MPLVCLFSDIDNDFWRICVLYLMTMDMNIANITQFALCVTCNLVAKCVMFYAMNYLAGSGDM